jgi:putative chitinase
MKNSFDKNLKIFLICLLVALSSCEAEKDFTTEAGKGKLVVKHCSMKDVSMQSNLKLHQAVDKLKSIQANQMLNANNNPTAKMIYEENSGLFYDDEKGVYVSKDGKDSYNFPVIQTNSNEKIENITFNKNVNNEYDIYLVKYDYTKEDLNNFSKAVLSQREVKYYPLVKDGVEYPIEEQWFVCTHTVTTTTYTEVHEGEGPGGTGLVFVCVVSISESFNCIYGWDNGGGGSGGGGGDGGGGGGGGGDGTYPTNPPPTNPPPSENPDGSILAAAVVTIDDDALPRKFPCLTAASLLDVFPNASLATRNKIANYVQIYGAYFGIDTKEKLQHFLGQIGGETAGLTQFGGEGMNYTNAARLVTTYPSKFTLTGEPGKVDPTPYLYNPQGLANFVYCCKYGNGDEASGDGWNYNGKGFMQLTWKANYDGYQEYLTSIGLGWMYVGPDSLNSPDRLHAVLSAMWYFKNKVLNKMTIDENTSVKKVTRKINSGLKGLTERTQFFNKAKEKINCDK